MPSGVLAKVAAAPSCPMRAAKEEEPISTPQIIRVTVTCLVCSNENRATVRSYVTWAAVACAERRSSRPQDEREPSARGGADHSTPPLQQSLRKLPLIQRYKDDTELLP